MHVLVIGGTRFVGRRIAEAVLAAGHALTLLNRGITLPGLFPEAKHLRGDRDAPQGLTALTGRSFDAVIDACAYHPRQVAALAPYADGFGHYTLISTVSVYREPLEAETDETGPVYRPEGARSAEDYGGLKVLCEEEAERLWPGRTLVLRSGLVAGPYDPTERFTYWPRRVARGGAILCPAPDQPVQLVDARDLAAFAASGVSRGLSGVFNVVGPDRPTTFAEMIAACGEVTGRPGDPVWAGDDVLLAEGLEPWQDLPLWLLPPDRNFCRIANTAAIDAGLCLRPLAETARDTLAWDRARAPAERVDPLSPEREERILAALDA